MTTLPAACQTNKLGGYGLSLSFSKILCYRDSNRLIKHGCNIPECQKKIKLQTDQTHRQTDQQTVQVKASRDGTRPYTRLPQSRAGGQGLYLRLIDHMGRSSEAKYHKKKPKNKKKSVTDRPTDGPTDQRTKGWTNGRTDKAGCRVARHGTKNCTSMPAYLIWC